MTENITCVLQGYTPLHIAMQFRHENVYRLLVEVYGKFFSLIHCGYMYKQVLIKETI